MRLCGLLLVGMVFLISVCAEAVESTERYPRSWYLPLTHERCSVIRERLRTEEFEGLRLPTGLYLQDHRDAWSRPDIHKGQLISEVRFELPGLVGTSHLGIVYPKGDPKSPELWLLLPGQQRYRLAQKRDGKWHPERFLPFPESDEHWKAVNGGVFWFNRVWRPFIKKHPNLAMASTDRQETEGQPILVSVEGDKNETQPMVAVKNINSRPTPLAFHHTHSNQVLMMTCPPDTRPDSNPDSFPACESMGVALIDLATGKGKLLESGVKWPVALTPDGIYSSEKGKVFLRAIDWGQKSFSGERSVIREMEKDETFLTYGFRFYIEKGNTTGTRRRPYTLSKDNTLVAYVSERSRFTGLGVEEDSQMELFQLDAGVDTPVDWLPEIQSGGHLSVYSNADIAKQLSRILGSSQRTFALIVYEDGQLPDQLVSDFVWKTVTQSIPTSESLSELERVYRLAPSAFDFEDREEITDRLEVLHEAVSGRRSIVYLSDFPSSEVHQVSRGNGESLFSDFWNYFQKSILSGESRVVLSMRADVYKELRAQFPGVFQYAEKVSVPNLTPEEILKVVEGYRADLERRKGKRFSKDGYEVFTNFVVSQGMGSRLQSPRREMIAMEDLFDYLETFSADSSTIDRAAMQDWLSYRSGQDTFRKRLNPKKVCEQLRTDVVSHDEIIDAVCVALDAIKSGNRIYETGPLAKFIFLGPTGAGKTFIPERLAELISGKDSIVKVDMSEFSRITADSPIYRKIKEAETDIRIVLFDDVDQIEDNRLAIDRLAGIMDNGIYGEGTEVELDFSNTMVFWTANWGEEIINRGDVTDSSIRDEIGLALTRGQNGDPAILKPRIWGRIESTVFPFRPFSTPQLLELGIVLAKNRIMELRRQNSKNVRVDPNLIMELVSQEKDARAGARSIKNRLGDSIFSQPVFLRPFVKADVTDLAIIQNEDALSSEPFVVLSNLDEGFADLWSDSSLLPDLSGWTEKQDQKFVCQYLRDNAGVLDVSVSEKEFEDYVQRFCQEGK